jgi:hypothetical protein
VEMERKRIYCFRRSAVSESDNVIEALKFEGMSGSPKAMNLGTGNYLLEYKVNTGWYLGIFK